MSHLFDEFSKSLAEESLPRRETLRRLGAVLTGAVLGPLALGAGAASAHPKGQRGKTAAQRMPWLAFKRDPCTSFCQRCRTKKQQSQCVAACRACGNDPSRLSGRCGTYTCADLSSDPNCGSVGNDCGAMGLTCCGGACADLHNDAAHCGACGNACGGSTPYCIAGTCSQCAPGQSQCGNACVYLASDVSNCGACGNTCTGSTPYCNGGECTQCPAGLALCGGVCIGITFDNANCGACGVVCDSYSTCAGGYCQPVEPYDPTGTY
ncbi:MAG: hypothetical protein AB7I48_02810 [Planctomycetaceae bacterium]